MRIAFLQILQFIPIAILIWCIPTMAKQEQLEITWVVSDTPPFHISRGSMANRGICDGLVNHLQSSIKHANFETRLVPQTRIGKMLANGAPICFPCMIHNAQPADRITYSEPTMLFPPFVVITTKQKARELNTEKAPIDIVELMTNSEWTFGKEAARRYGSLQAVISSLPAFRNSIISHNSTDTTTAIAELISRGRIDYTIDYPTTLKLFQQRGYNNLTGIPIKQAEQFIVGAVGCSASNPEFSNRAIKLINDALHLNVLNSESYKEHLNFWMNGYPHYRSWYNKKVLKAN